MAGGAYGKQYRAARAEAFRRSGGVCQLCGAAQATDAHHWAFNSYPSGEEVTGDDLVALCGLCHEIATNLRRTLKRGASRFEIAATINRSVAECNTESQSPAPAPSSITTGQPGLTDEALSAVRSQRSRPSGAEIAPKPTTTGSENSNANALFGSTRAERLRSQRQLSGPASKAAQKSESRERKIGAGWWC